jgi:hypothetical protein
MFLSSGKLRQEPEFDAHFDLLTILMISGAVIFDQ